MYQQQQNLYAAQGGPVQGAEPLMPSSLQPIGYGQDIPLVVQPIPQDQQEVLPTNLTPFKNQQQPYMANQNTYVQTANLKSRPVLVFCPFCKNNVITLVETHFNWLSCLCCLISRLIIWSIFQCMRNKDLNCNDATHRCPSCGNIIGTYSAC